MAIVLYKKIEVTMRKGDKLCEISTGRSVSKNPASMVVNSVSKSFNRSPRTSRRRDG